MQRTISSLCASAGLAVVATVAPVWAGDDDSGHKKNDTKIFEALVDFSAGSEAIVILGQKFNGGSDKDFKVLLGVPGDPGDITDLCLVDSDAEPELIVCSFAGTGLPPAGDYLLTVTRTKGSSDSKRAEHMLTVGATGPAGPAGEDGMAGPPGEKGDKGDPGEKGDQGDPGEKGDQGDPGEKGDQGDPGEKGDQGDPGEKGDQGDPGEKGDQGDPGEKGDQGDPGVKGDQGDPGEKGDQGDPGIPGPPGDAGPQGDTGLNCWDLNGNGTPDITGDPATNEDVNGDGAVNVFDCKGDQVINLTVEIPEVPGIVAQDFVTLFPDAAQNTTTLEISGVCEGLVVVVNGPAVEIELVEGFGPVFPDDNSGLAVEQPLVIEAYEVEPGTGGSSQSCNPENLDAYLEDFANTGNLVQMRLVTRDSGGNFSTEWLLNNYRPDGPGVPGFDGRTRYVFDHDGPPDNFFDIVRSPDSFNTLPSFNPATDFRVFINSQNTGEFPAVPSEDLTEARVILVFDYNEGGEVFRWVRETIEQGTTNTGKTGMSIEDHDPSGTGSGNPRNYFGCFPVRWEQRGGFRQDIKLKDYVVVECDHAETF